MTSNNVTLEQLNAPTDLEEALRCLPQAIPRNPNELVDVYIGWSANDHQFYDCASLPLYKALEVERLMQSYHVPQEASRSETHEDEELMIRVKLDEGV
jgi:hypothetical protein